MAPRIGSSPSDGALRTDRARMKAERRENLLQAAAELVAERGYHGLRLEDLGAAVGISGPAVYRHFPNKEAVLVELLVGISEYLQGGGDAVVAAHPSPDDAIRALVDFHLDFAVSSPRLIEIQFRDLANLPDDARRRVRLLQRTYVETWVSVLRRLDSDHSEDDARVRAHAAFGLLNSTPHSVGRVPTSDLEHRLSAMALKALSVSPVRPTSEEPQ